MTHLSILVGFRYEGDIEASVVDLYRVYQFSRNSGGQVVVLSDIEEIPHSVSASIIRGHVEDDISAFCTSGRDPVNREERQDLTWIMVQSKIDVKGALARLALQHDHKIIIYYTGHGEVSESEPSMILPNKDAYPFVELRDDIVSLTANYAEILFVLDCCYPGSLALPYQLKKEVLKEKGNEEDKEKGKEEDKERSKERDKEIERSKEKGKENDKEKWRFRLVDTSNMVVPLILLITSAHVTQPSVARSHGSLFTDHFVAALNGRVNNMATLIAAINDKMGTQGQMVNIYCSYAILPVMWTWLFTPLVDVYINEPTCSVMVEVRQI